MTRELSPQQRRVMALVALGLENKLIAHELGISVHTVKSHVHEALRNLGCRNRMLAVRELALKDEAELSQ